MSEELQLRLEEDENEDEETDGGPSNKRQRQQGDQGRCSKQLSKRTYSRKRKFGGNRTKKTTTNKLTASEKKVKQVKKQKKVDVIEGYRIVDMGLLQTLITSLACPDCLSTKLHLEENDKKKKGLSSFLVISCDECDFSTSSYTSKRAQYEESRGLKPFDINVRSVYTFRNLGIGHKGLEKYCGLMNMPPPMTVMNYNKISNHVKDAAEYVAEISMQAATSEAVVFNKYSADIGVSVDGTWQRRGYVSLNGVVVAISIDVGKIVDAEVLTRYCRQCDIMRRELPDADFKEWFEQHLPNCVVNHDGTAPAMECVGALRIFGRSVKSRGVRYVDYYGDGDSKGYANVKNEYPGIVVNKKECIGHYQKRVGTRLQKLKKILAGRS